MKKALICILFVAILAAPSITPTANSEELWKGGPCQDELNKKHKATSEHYTAINKAIQKEFFDSGKPSWSTGFTADPRWQPTQDAWSAETAANTEWYKNCIKESQQKQEESETHTESTPLHSSAEESPSIDCKNTDQCFKDADQIYEDCKAGGYQSDCSAERREAYTACNRAAIECASSEAIEVNSVDELFDAFDFGSEVQTPAEDSSEGDEILEELVDDFLESEPVETEAEEEEPTEEELEEEFLEALGNCLIMVELGIANPSCETAYQIEFCNDYYTCGQQAHQFRKQCLAQCLNVTGSDHSRYCTECRAAYNQKISQCQQADSFCAQRFPLEQEDLRPHVLEVTGVKGEIFVSYDEGDEPRLLEPGEGIASDALIVTAPGSELFVKFPDGSEVSIGENSTVLTDSTFFGDQMTDVVLGLRMGRVRADIRPQSPIRAGFSVVTPTCTASVRGTEFSVFAAEDGTTQVQTLHGEVEVTDHHTSSTVNVKPGFSTTVKPEAAPTKPSQTTGSEILKASPPTSYTSWVIGGVIVVLLISGIVVIAKKRKQL